MKWTPAAIGLLSAIPLSSHAAIYLSIEQAQALIFPNETLQHLAITLSDDQIRALKAASNIYHPLATNNIYKSSHGGWLVVDQVLGKHEMITYAVGLNANGTIKQIEILEYNESYGSQVRNSAWRNQFVGKSSSNPIALNNDIQNISGATLSSKHLTDGVKRITLLYDLVLRKLVSNAASPTPSTTIKKPS